MDETILEKLPRYSWAEFKKHIEEEKPFEALSPMGTALFRVKRYEPLVALAVHAGHQVREELLSKMAIDENDRLYEEDYGVEQLISEFPIQMIGLDSRYEYDLNRPREQAVYLKPFQSWGKKVWVTPPSKEELEISFQKYDEFHEMLGYLVEQLCERFGKTLILDVHSYNHKRPNHPVKPDALPLFHVATCEKDHETHGKAVQTLLTDLAAVKIDGVQTNVKENSIFKKDGAISMNLGTNLPTCLAVPVEVKKLYFDEKTLEMNPAITGQIAKALASIGTKMSQTYFSKK